MYAFLPWFCIHFRYASVSTIILVYVILIGRPIDVSQKPLSYSRYGTESLSFPRSKRHTGVSLFRWRRTFTKFLGERSAGKFDEMIYTSEKEVWNREYSSSKWNFKAGRNEFRTEKSIRVTLNHAHKLSFRWCTLIIYLCFGFTTSN